MESRFVHPHNSYLHSFCKTDRLPVVFLILFLGSIFLLPTQFTVAQSFKLPLPVDDYRELEGGMAEVQIGNARRIVPTEDVLTHIAQRYLSFRILDERLNPAELERYLLTDISSLKADQIGPLLALLLRQSRYKAENSFDELKYQLRSREDYNQILRALFLAYEGAIPVRNEIHEFLYDLLRIDLSWVASELKTRARSDRFREYLVAKYRMLIRAGEFQEASELVDSIGILFGENSASHKELVQLRGKVTNSQNLLEQDTIQDLLLLMKRVREDREVGDLLDEMTLQRVHRKAEQLISERLPSQALTLLAEVDPRERTPTTLRLLKLAISSLRVQDSDSPLFESSNFAVVQEMSEGSYPVKKQVLDYLDKQTLRFLEQQKYDDALRAFDLVRDMRSDPDRRNDSLRFHFGLQYLKEGRRSAAEQVFSEMDSDFSFREMFQLLQVGYFSQRFVMSLLALIFLVLLLLLLLVRRHARLRSMRSEYSEDDDSSVGLGGGATEARLSRGFERIGLKHGLDPRIQEYRLLLHRLGVGPEADIQVIKATYRQKLKKLHPDLQDSTQGGSREEFYKLKETYEKILQLRSLLELDVQDSQHGESEEEY